MLSYVRRYVGYGIAYTIGYTIVCGPYVYHVNMFCIELRFISIIHFFPPVCFSCCYHWLMTRKPCAIQLKSYRLIDDNSNLTRLSGTIYVRFPMANINCPAPDFEASWPDTTPPEALHALINLHVCTAHPIESGLSTYFRLMRHQRGKGQKVHPAGTSEEWSYFDRRWSEYKAATHLTGTGIAY